MTAPGVKLEPIEGGGLMFRCPGCEESHVVFVGTGDGPRWGYNGNPEKPTFTPSVLIKSGHFASSHKPDDPCWCNYEARFGRKPHFKCKVCHSFITDGRIQFLGDCTHALAGQTVDLPDWSEDE